MLAFLRRNPQFQKLWGAQIVSSTGDWLNRIAVLALIDQLGGTGQAAFTGLLFALEYALRTLPTTIFSGLAGPLADRLPRRTLMIVADVVRAAVVLCLLLVDRPEELWLLYALIFLQMSVGIFFDSARSGALPNTVQRSDLHLAYALSAATFSTMLSVGAFLGGVLVSRIGIQGVFLCDAATYLLSACFLIRLELPATPRQPQPLRARDVLRFTDVRRGFGHVRDLGIWPILFSKVLWSPCGGFLVLFPILARRYEPEGSVEELSWLISLFFIARGVGTGIGPLISKRLLGSHRASLIRQAWGGMLLGGLGYLALIFAPNLELSLLAVTIAHVGGSAQWVGSTTYWQQAIEDGFRGRVFACEFALMTLSFAVFAFVGGITYDLTLNLEATLGLLVVVSLACSQVARIWFRRLPGAGGEDLTVRPRST